MHDELVYIEDLVRNVLCDHRTMEIYENLSFWANHPLLLFGCEEGGAEGTPAQLVYFLLKQKLKFFHINLAA